MTHRIAAFEEVRNFVSHNIAERLELVGDQFANRVKTSLSSSSVQSSVDPDLDADKAELDDTLSPMDVVMVLVILAALLFFEAYLNPTKPDIYKHVAALLCMMLLSLCYNLTVWFQRGGEEAVAWLTGYIVEWALSMDNLFVFHLVFKGFKMPRNQQARALSIGIYAAIVFRIAFILCLTELFMLGYGVDLCVGALLIISGILSLGDEEDEEEIQSLCAVRFFKWLFGSRLQDNYSEDGSLFQFCPESGRLQMTVMFLVVCVISVVDVIFAVDSVGSKTGQIKNLYINVTSCLMAMLSLRSLFFVIEDMAVYFEYVKYGICAILCFVGGEMAVSKWYHVSLLHMCIVIVVLFVGSVLVSVLKAAPQPSQKVKLDNDIQESAGHASSSGDPVKL
jgi:tellurite resistance protein TerC